MYKYLVFEKIIKKVVSELNELKNNYLISKKRYRSTKENITQTQISQ